MASRKNHTLKLAGILLALVLVTSCFVGGTFAKYVTTGTGSDSARVAKFGVKVTAEGSTFATSYDKDNAAKTVVSSTLDKVVAPGTSGEMAAINITGKPEVSVKVSYEAKVDMSRWVDAGGKFYCPLEIVVKKLGENNQVANHRISGLDYDTLDAFKTAIKNEIDGYTVTYQPKTSLAEKNSENLQISWSWAFAGKNGQKYSQTDIQDTFLGDEAAEDRASTISLTVTTTVTQID